MSGWKDPEKRREYMKAYRIANAERLHEYNTEWRENNQEYYRQYNAEWCKRNKDKISEKNRRYREAHRDEINRKRRERRRERKGETKPAGDGTITVDLNKRDAWWEKAYSTENFKTDDFTVGYDDLEEYRTIYRRTKGE